jgi:phosphate transport system substrate-binding protein
MAHTLSASRRWWMAGAALLAVGIVAGCGSTAGGNNAAMGNSANAVGNATAGGAPVTLAESGSSLLYPLFNNQWIPAYKSVAPNVTLTAESSGSGTGIAKAIAGQVQIGASDAYLSDAQMKQHPNMLNIPLAVSAQQVMYNVPGLPKDTHLHLDGPTLAAIYEGKVQYWDDAALKQLNPGVKLPHQRIVPVHRSDSSGDTFLFTQYLSDTDAGWKSSVAYGTSVSWPSVQGALGAKGNSGVVQALASTPGSIGYVGISWLDKGVEQGLGYAALKNHNGQFVLPTQDAISAEANAGVSQVPDDERVSLIDLPADGGYPIVNFEYAIVNSQQPADVADALKKFLTWAIDPQKGGSSQYLTPVHFLPLPSAIESKSLAQIQKIGQ